MNIGERLFVGLSRFQYLLREVRHMAFSELHVQMLGRFSLRIGDRELNDSNNRSRKVWLLLAYMIYCRNRPISQDELVGLLWKDEEGSTNPANALKTMFHRVRSMLNQINESAGRTLILNKGGNYAWNCSIPFTFDAEDFDTLVKVAAAAPDPSIRLEKQLEALELYEGDFLPKLSTEPWVVPLSAYFHNVYLQTILDVLPMLEAQSRTAELVTLCRRAVEIEPYNELLYQYLMRGLIAQGNQRGAIIVYEDMSNLLFSNFGIMPSDETKAVYREAVQTINERAISLGTLREQLKEPGTASGALFCDYDFFKIIYHAEARAVARNGDAVHIGLLSLTDESGEELPKRSLERCMENMRNLICLNLRKGDIASQCSISQFILMLPQANYENSCMVCERVIRAYCRQYPHSPATLHYSVQPLEPNA